MPEAQEGEVTILEVETLGFGKTKVNFFLYIMTISNMYLFGYKSCSHSGESALGGNERRCGLAEVR